MVKIIPYGDQALLVNFEEKIELNINRQVHQLHEFLKSEFVDGITFCIPAYCSLTVGFDKSVIQLKHLCDKILEFDSTGVTDFFKKEKRKFTIPVCYHLDFFLDQDEVEQQTNLSAKEIIQLHTDSTYQVFMMGFLPGFAYLGKISEQLFCSRKMNPRKKVAKGSVALAGFQTGIYPSNAPGGWQIIGKSPVPLFRPNNTNPFLFQTGDEVSFQAISKSDFFQLEKMIEKGELSNTDFYE